MIWRPCAVRPRSPLARAIAAPALLLLLAAGCAGRREYRLGLEHLEQGRIDSAYRLLTRAYLLNPREAYRRAWLEAGLRKARFHVEWAREALALGRPGAALDEYVRALDLAPDEAWLRQEYGSLRDSLWDAESGLARALDLSTESRWGESLGILWELRPEAVIMPEIEGALGKVARRAYSTEIALAGELASEGAWSDARRHLLSILDLSERFPGLWSEEDVHEARDTMDRVRVKQRVSELLDLACKARTGGDLDRAYVLTEEALGLDPRDPLLRHRYRWARTELASSLENEARSCISLKEWQEAVPLLRRVLEVAPDSAGVSTLLGNAARAAAGDAFSRAQGLRTRGLFGSALLAYLECQSLDPDLPGLGKGIAACEDAIRASAKGEVEVRIWSGGPCGRVREVLARVLPGARPVVSDIPYASGRSPLVEVDRPEWSWVVDHLNVEGETSTYVERYMEVANPLKDSYENALDEAIRSLESCERRLRGAVPAESTFLREAARFASIRKKRILRRLESFPEMVRQPLVVSAREPVRYRILRASLVLPYRLPGEEIEDTIRIETSLGDRFGVLSPEALRRTMEDEALLRLAESLHKKLVAAGCDQAFEAARRCLTAGLTDAGIEHLVRFVYSVPRADAIQGLDRLLPLVPARAAQSAGLLVARVGLP